MPRVADDLIDLRDGGQTGVPYRLGMIAAETLHQIGQPFVGDHRQVRRRVAGVNQRAARPLQYDDRLAGGAQQVRSGQPRQSTANDDDIGVLIGREPLECGHRGGVNPERFRRGCRLCSLSHESAPLDE